MSELLQWLTVLHMTHDWAWALTVPICIVLPAVIVVPMYAWATSERKGK